MSRRIAMTGATGFIGRHAAARLVSRGDEVRAIVRIESKRPIPPPGVSVVRAPLELEPLRAAFHDVDVVVHLAGVVSARDPRTYYDVNLEGTRQVARAARAIGARLVHISSLAAAGPAPASAPRGEDDPPRPINPYGKSKLASEQFIASVDGLQWIVLRPGVVYGPGDRAVLSLFRMAKRGWLPALGTRNAAYTFVYVDDLVAAIERAIDSACSSDVMFVGHPAPVTTARMATAMGAALGRRVTLVRVPDLVARAALIASEIAGALIGREMPLNRRRFGEMSAVGFACRVDRLRERLGVVPRVDLEEGVRRTAEWYRREGWL